MITIISLNNKVERNFEDPRIETLVATNRYNYSFSVKFSKYLRIEFYSL